MEYRLHPAGDRRRILLDGSFPGCCAGRMHLHIPWRLRAGRAFCFTPVKRHVQYSTPAVSQGMTMRWFGGIRQASATFALPINRKTRCLNCTASRAVVQTGIRWIASRGRFALSPALAVQLFHQAVIRADGAAFQEICGPEGPACHPAREIRRLPVIGPVAWRELLLMLGYFDDPAPITWGFCKIRVWAYRALVYPARMDSDFTARGWNHSSTCRPGTCAACTISATWPARFCPCDIRTAHPDLEKTCRAL